MSKKPNHVNVSRSIRVMPDGTAIAVGGTVHIAAADKKHPVVAGWIADEVLVPIGSKAAKHDDDADAQASIVAERDAALKSLADAAAAWTHVRESLAAEEGSDDAKALEDRIAALDAVFAPSS